MYLRYVITFVLLATVVVLLTVMGTVWSMPDLPGSVGQSICLPRVLPDGSRSSQLYCGEMADMLRTYLETATDREYNKAQAKDIKARKEIAILALKGVRRFSWRRQPAARVVGTPLPDPRPSDKNSSLVPIRVWNHNQHNRYGGFMRYGIQYRNGRLTVPVTGTYSIYSFLDMREYCDLETGIPNIASQDSIQHSIFKFNILDGKETELISSVQPHIIARTRRSNIYNTYLSSIVELKRGDELSVKCSNISYLKSPTNNYFGVHLL